MFIVHKVHFYLYTIYLEIFKCISFIHSTIYSYPFFIKLEYFTIFQIGRTYNKQRDKKLYQHFLNYQSISSTQCKIICKYLRKKVSSYMKRCLFQLTRIFFLHMFLAEQLLRSFLELKAIGSSTGLRRDALGVFPGPFWVTLGAAGAAAAQC